MEEPSVMSTDEAQNRNNRVHRPGNKDDDVFSLYSQWAQDGTYESDLAPQNYRGPSLCAEALATYLSEKEAKILDIAAGTGFVAEKLREHGYTNIDMVEPARGMVEKAKAKRLYGQYFVVPFTSDMKEFSSDSYDAVVCAGGMGEGHIKCDALPEMARIVKPGGYVIIVMRKSYLKIVEDYVGRLEPMMEEMEKKGLWHCLAKTEVERYSFDNVGVVFAFQINKKTDNMKQVTRKTRDTLYLNNPV